MKDAESQLALLTAQIDQVETGPELLAVATRLDELGRDVAEAFTQSRDAALRPVLLGIPRAYTQALLRAAEKYDDAGSPRRAVFALVEALGRAFDANMVAVVGGVLAFVLDANEQEEAASRTRVVVSATEDASVSRRELRQRFLASVAELREQIEWNALEDEPSTS